MTLMARFRRKVDFQEALHLLASCVLVCSHRPVYVVVPPETESFRHGSPTPFPPHHLIVFMIACSPLVATVRRYLVLCPWQKTVYFMPVFFCDVCGIRPFRMRTSLSPWPLAPSPMPLDPYLHTCTPLVAHRPHVLLFHQRRRC